MTESEWQTCTDPQKMLEFLRGKASDRKLRLFAYACCRRIMRLLSDEWKAGLKLAEGLAEGTATKDQISQARRKLAYNRRTIRESDNGEISAAKEAVLAALCLKIYRSALDASRFALVSVWRSTEEEQNLRAEYRWQANCLREFFGNLFRPVSLKPASLTWNDGTILKLAQTIYDECAFDRLPILADALEESGCTNSDILHHCRQPGEHVRGCWVIDLILGKR